MRALLFHNWYYKLISLLIALAFSYYIYGFGSYEIEASVYYPLEVRNLSRKLAIASPLPQRIAVTVRGTPQAIREVKNLGGSAALDFSNIEEPGNYVLTPLLPPVATLKLVRPEMPIRVEVEPFAEKEIEVEVAYKGALEKDFILREVEVTPLKVKVSGGSRFVKVSAHALAELDLSGRRNTIATSLPLSIVDKDYRVIPSNLVSIDPPFVYVRATVSPIANVKVIPVKPVLEVETKEGYYVSDARVEPSQVLVDESRLPKGKDVAFIQTEEIKASGVSESFVANPKLIYPFSDTAGLPEKVKVSVVVRKMEESSVSLSVPIEITGGKQGYAYEVSPEKVLIESPDLGLLSEAQKAKINARIDVANLGLGEFRIVPSVTVPNDLRRMRIIPLTVVLKVSVGEANDSSTGTEAKDDTESAKEGEK